MIESPQTHESHAKRVVLSLRGYVNRQAWIVEDTAVIAEILREWHDEVIALESRVSGLETDLKKSQLEVEQWRNAAYSHRTT